MKNYFLMSIRLSLLIRMIFGNRGISLRYILRLIPLSLSGIITEIFSFAEKIKFGKLINQTPVPKNPVFIVSHWRTGSTLLHELINLDDQFAAPTLLEVATPEHFLISARYYRKFISLVIGKTRPIDNFAVNINSPHEHEFALLKMPGFSPLERTIFIPRAKKNYFLNDMDSLIKDSMNSKNFKKSYIAFIKKIHIKNEKRIILKNPLDSLRIKWLKATFPEAKFIHIIRNPVNVVPSTLKMWKTTTRDNLLKGRYSPPSLSEITLILFRFEEAIFSAFKTLSRTDHITVKYEDLVLNPVETIQKAYFQLNLQITQKHKDAIILYMKNNEKNKSKPGSLPQVDLDEIQNCVKDCLTLYRTGFAEG